MNFEEYQRLSRESAIYPNMGKNFVYPVIGLTGEIGEVAEKVKKTLRDNNGIIDNEKRQEILKELGDVLWYIAQMASELGVSLDRVATFNIEKTRSRKERGKISGSGDNR